MPFQAKLCRLSALVILALLMCLPAHAGTLATFGGKDTTTNNYQIEATKDTTTGNKALAFHETAIRWTYSEHTGSTTNSLTAYESGSVIQDSFGATHTLPNAVLGMEFTIAPGYDGNGNAVTSTVDTADVSDTIIYSVSGTTLDAGDKIVSAGDAGDSVTLICTSANEWSIKSMNGNWTDGGQ